MSHILEICKSAKDASFQLANVSSIIKENALKRMASNIIKNQQFIIDANNVDVENAKNKGISGALLDRLTLTPQRVKAMADGLIEIAGLPDPIGEIVGAWKRPNGLEIGQKRVPIGVVGVIYEARPNVTADVAGLTLKSGNCAILKGGSEAINSNKAIIEQITEALKQEGICEHAVQLITDTNREAAVEMLKMDKYIDVLIPRGGEGLKKIILENSTIPVIMATAGNCHVYVDASANLAMAEKIVINAKTQRPGVCNAMETLLVNKDVAEVFIPRIVKLLQDEGVEIRGCEITRKYAKVKSAEESDWSTEYLDLILAVKVVNSFDEATEHINKYGTRHSEAIVTENYEAARRFHDVVDAAAVYVNASTRFTDGFEFGFGAEIGISNQKLHARGPIGLKQLTSLKYIIYGSGQIR
jgi:glutamate-5-semialdehyde dehydrogenase